MAEARFEGRRALVTGAGSGIGEAVARGLHADGAQVVLADLAGDRVQALAGELGPRARALTLDVRDEDAVAAAMGGLDVLANIAGIGSTTNAPDTPLEVWENVFAVNARGTFLCCKHAIPGMIERGGGAIVNTSSVAGLVGLPNRAAYCASKGAVLALTRALAIDHVRQGVRVNAVCPERSTRPGSDVSSTTPANRSTRCAPASRWADWARPTRSPRRSSTSPPTRRRSSAGLVIDGGLTAA